MFKSFLIMGIGIDLYSDLRNQKYFKALNFKKLQFLKRDFVDLRVLISKAKVQDLQEVLNYFPK